ncbi:hypothetical protein B14_200030 (plasmid) [Bacillus licheniformis]|uniref:hypothetical protein n=1 Tax=Bacillus subtilis group TaxID=653685 RepID=UPI0009B7CB38|nr:MULTISPECIES: hypothetical protein [Bacillus subtilis group]ARC67241.1 hypothetical protein B14_200030 [Bacillus licheniformis]ARW46119.1 hypothetical protein S100141_04899 [Bacillus licheniformis]MDE1421898.1 hypothetical protein [Bacillus licheniformis]MEC0475903.1 hypothetical protein [Bacillus licheniformis]PLC14134.1 hypothetical protein BV582_21430 [Bacillus paralicheniformis]
MKTVNQIKSATSREEVRSVLEGIKIELQHIYLLNAIDALNKEIVTDIKEDKTDKALFKMSQVIMLEDENHVVERLILKQAVVLS